MKTKWDRARTVHHTGLRISILCKTSGQRRLIQFFQRAVSLNAGLQDLFQRGTVLFQCNIGREGKRIQDKVTALRPPDP